ncbi:MAG: Uma2 family endonuclease [candidate division KSB1 bacterium]|nr:Uma2 family endonuclease [candidate division KSB1 bacterium]MDZ7276600.1 Uma2 family endonuclease [candidate division KSB1 bacterium]MDZ7300382.1 Uma2 family endonuclease [candidate division KSB1 bacterium]MDZ7307800.1 Uma2 family endonuclease [candidate division KSB1 bacterium]MDZ7351382.1 Uma2 family endonuclease [candidate division KSB1 bacterium]
MAAMTNINVSRASQNEPATLSTRHDIPIEQRTDVTVDELEGTSLPCPAELYDGKVVYKMANYAHGKSQTRFISKLDRYLEEHPIGDLVTETNFRLWPELPDQSRIPDVAFVKNERVPDDPHRFPALAPDLVIEIISPEDNFMQVMNKVDAYLEQGTQMIWLVITITREVLVCTTTGKYSVRDLLTAPDRLPGFELPVSKIFEGIPLPPRS